MAEQEYEILPHQLLSDLKYDVEALKKKLTQPDAKINELILEIESMKDSVHELNTIFEKALAQTKETDIDKVVKSLNAKLSTVVTQNETIAKGMIAISDKLEDFMEKQAAPTPVAVPAMAPPPPHAMAKHSMGPPPTPGPARTAPKPMAPPPGPGLPPPPASPKKRRGLFK